MDQTYCSEGRQEWLSRLWRGKTERTWKMRLSLVFQFLKYEKWHYYCCKVRAADFFPLNFEQPAYFSIGEIVEVVAVQSDQAKRLLHLVGKWPHYFWEKEYFINTKKERLEKQGTCLIQMGNMKTFQYKVKYNLYNLALPLLCQNPMVAKALAPKKNFFSFGPKSDHSLSMSVTS